MPDRRRLVVALAGAAVLPALWLAAPPMGTDLSAQVARADFFAGYGWAPVDFRWYGGVQPLGYSLLTPPLMAWAGPRPVGAAAAVVSTLALLFLFRRTAAPRPLLGAGLGAVAFTGNLVSGRVTFAVGIALGLLALSVLIMECFGRVAGAPEGNVHDQRVRRAVRWAGAGILAALAAAASPVAGLFTGLAGTAVVLGAGLPTRGPGGGPGRVPAAGGLALVVGAAVPLAATAGLFGSGGWMNMSRSDLVHAAVASLAVAALVPHRVVRIGALLSAAGLVAAYLLPTPVGLNATRLATLFTLPLVAGYATVPGWLARRLPAPVVGARRQVVVGRPVVRGRWPVVGGRWPAIWLVPVLAVLAWWQPPVLDDDLAGRGDPTASPAYFAPLQAELARRRPAGRVEVVPTAYYWESAHLAAAPLARGWLRQVDLARNQLFFDGSLDAGSYRRWLTVNGVSYVALAGAETAWVGRAEAELIRQRPPYLTPVWEHPDWTLYEVDGAGGIVEPPGTLVAAAPDRVVVEATRPGEFRVRVRWSAWLAVTGPAAACVAPAGRWTAVRVTGPGDYQVTGSVTGAGPRC
jgi:hypothetical protein